jgi:hypothetical protein
MPSPKYIDDVADMIRRLVRPAGSADDMLDTAGDAATLARNAPPPRMQIELPMDAAPARAPSFDGVEAMPPQAVDLSLDSPAFSDLSRSADRFLQMRRGQSANLRNQPFNAVAGQAIRDAADARQMQIAADARMGQAAKGAAGVGLGAAAVGGMLAGGGKKPAPASADMTSTDGTAELANESRPAPAVEAEPDVAAKESAAVKRNLLRREMQRAEAGEGAYDPRHQAQVMLKDLNNRRMKAGGEVPESREMMAQINELLAKADQQTNARTSPQAQAYAKGNPTDPHAQASALIAQLNDMRRKAGGEVPEGSQIMAEVRRLQSMGDQQRNAQTTARR